MASSATTTEIRLNSDPEQIADARRIIEGVAAAAGFAEASAGQIGLCVNEALANVIRHAYSGVPGMPIHLTVEIAREGPSVEMRLKIRDWGNGRNPADCPPRPRDLVEPGGVGMICLRELMDEIHFSPQPDGMLTTMIKRQPPPRKESGTA